VTRTPPNSYRVELPDVALQVTEWPGSSDPVLLLHATGFHSRCWDSIARELAGIHLFAVDIRFHGGSDRHGPVNWLLLAADIEALVDRLDLQRAVGVGHSLGGYLAAYVGATRMQRFKQLVLIDPVILPREVYAGLVGQPESVSPAQSPVSRRKNRWRDAQEMYQRFRNRAPFAGWDDRVLRDYCDHALRAVPRETALQLACDPLHEASIYLSQSGNEAIYNLLPRLTIPVTVLRAPRDPDNPHNLAASPTWPGLVNALPNARDLFFPELTHFIPMEAPARVAQIVRQAVEESWPGST
jgi:pimeloyl-ACP methyl ester carboxylesterase